MKVAIVHGGFAGIRRQHSVWRLQSEVEQAERVLQERAAGTKKARSTLLNLQNALLRAQREVR